MGYNAKKVIDVALSWVGYLEKKDGNVNYLRDKKANAGYNNYTWFGYKMHQLDPAVMDYPAYWCDAFVDYCFWEAYGEAAAKELLCGGFNDYTPASSNQYKKAGRWVSSPKAGDQIFFQGLDTEGKYRINHTGIVEKVENNRVYTIEGNTRQSEEVIPNGGAVCKKSYPLYSEKIAGYGRPPYDEGKELHQFKVEEIEKGDKGTSVLLMYEILRARDYKMKNGKILKLSRTFGEQGEYALKQYQAERGLPVTGKCDSTTWHDLLGM